MKNILLVGGTGLQGQLTQQLLQERQTSAKLFISSRKVGSTTILIDVDQPQTFQNILTAQIDLVVMCTVDPKNELMQFCIERGLDYLDITKTSMAIATAHKLALSQQLRSNIVLASSWMGSAVPGLIQDVMEWRDIEGVELLIYYSMRDKAGASAADFMAENAAKKFPIYRNGKEYDVRHFEGRKKHQFAFSSSVFNLYHFDAPDNYVFHHIEGIPNVSTAITYGDNLSGHLLSLMQKWHVFDILPISLRKKLFYANGTGDKTAFDIQLTSKKGEVMKIGLINEQGQANLTAFSTVMHIEKLLSDGELLPGVYFGHQLYSKGAFSTALSQNVNINISIA
ncbi:hypothetical protein [Flavobacterium sp. NKUCC04_CG]|uniref:hypothetical protein n=1 Tax=Flavobacterium sp. NKUCC04_CG TaxID=2842121 RepID=UPI001C5AC341|nr:hypothetical protein [Flavobacterium sp. NKUCC04_CG]MBW3519824.1 hypothetical protein [Flavobacterium sp. NKUCC04_CG]